MPRSPPPQDSGSRTLTTTAASTDHGTDQETVAVLRLRAGPSRRRRVVWDEGVVDNEGLGRKSSKICCIYHKPRKFDESSTESSSGSSSESDDDDEFSGRGNGHGLGQRGSNKLPKELKDNDENDDNPASKKGKAKASSGKSRSQMHRCDHPEHQHETQSPASASSHAQVPTTGSVTATEGNATGSSWVEDVRRKKAERAERVLRGEDSNEEQSSDQSGSESSSPKSRARKHPGKKGGRVKPNKYEVGYS